MWRLAVSDPWLIVFLLIGAVAGVATVAWIDRSGMRLSVAAKCASAVAAVVVVGLAVLSVIQMAMWSTIYR